MTGMRTWHITVQPWGKQRISITVAEASYTKHGRQKWDQVSRVDYSDILLVHGLGLAADQVMQLYANYYVELEDAQEAEGRAAGGAAQPPSL